MQPEVIAEYVSFFGNAVEVCTGYYSQVAELLKKMGKLLCACDINGDAKEKFLNAGIRFFECDVLNPCPELLKYCRKADVVYSIRPPVELWRAIAKLAEECGCACIIRPMVCDADAGSDVNYLVDYYKGEMFYVFRV